ncbi:hypothetical protein BDV93DRAFT_526019 [Ceratobasidium sp. AG-I]|nr:hypothetical protein BDV93DRAFT_526019 [Ceratobasidium sp. AG-I]
MQQQQDLYNLGARNLFLFYMPPRDRSPMGTPIAEPGPKILAWNAQLAASALRLSVQNTDTSTRVFSSWDTFIGILNDFSQRNISDLNTIGWRMER